jgi:spartin
VRGDINAHELGAASPLDLIMTSAEGFLLLTIPNCTLTTQDGASQSGVLALECVTIPLQGPQTVFSGSAPRDTSNERDVWLVIRLNNFETIVSPIQTITHARNQHQFTIPAEDGGVVTLTVPAPMTDSAVEDLESLEVLLSQYGVLQETGIGASPGKGGDTKGRLVLVDEDNGAMLGTLGEQFQIREDPGLVSKGHEKDPVVIDIPEQGEQVFVHNIAPDEQDWLLRSAGYIR